MTSSQYDQSLRRDGPPSAPRKTHPINSLSIFTRQRPQNPSYLQRQCKGGSLPCLSFPSKQLLERKITPRTKLICLLWQNCAKTVSLAGKKLKKRTSASFTRCHYEWSQEDEASKTFIHLHWAVCVFGSLNTKHCLPGCLSLGLISVSTGIALKVVFAWVNDCLVTNLLIISHSLQLPACSVHRSLYGVTAVMWLYYKSGWFFVFFLARTSPPVPQTLLFWHRHC